MKVSAKSQVGDNEVLSESFDVIDTSTVLSSFVQRGIATFEEAKELADTYRKFHNSRVVVVKYQRTETVVYTPKG